MKKSARILLLIMMDSFSFLIAGVLSLWVSVILGKSDLISPSHLFDFGVRARMTDLLIAGLVWIFWFHFILNRYQRAIPFWSEFTEIIKAIGFMALVNLAVIALARGDFSRWIWMVGWLALIPTLPLLRAVGRHLLRWVGYLQRPAWIIGSDPAVTEVTQALETEWQMGFELQGHLDPSEVSPSAFPPLQSGLHASGATGEGVFIIALDESGHAIASHLVGVLTAAGVGEIYIIPALRGIPLYGAELTHFFSHEVLLVGLRNNLAKRFSRILKGVFDALVSLLLMPFALILLGVCGYLIWREDGAPIFYVQERLGRGLTPFRMIKLRTMRKDADHQLKLWQATNSPEWQTYQVSNYKLERDPRLLRIGHILRKSSIDELPQLLNVFRGDMSLVGPRPILAREVEEYGSEIVLYQSVKPGMSGLWQISGRSRTSFSQRAALDAWYVRNWSVGYDIIILIRTISVVMRAKGAY